MAWIGRPSAGWPRRSLSSRAPRFPSSTEAPLHWQRSWEDGAFKTQADCPLTRGKNVLKINGRYEVSQEISIPVMARCSPSAPLPDTPHAGAD